MRKFSRSLKTSPNQLKPTRNRKQTLSLSTMKSRGIQTPSLNLQASRRPMPRPGLPKKNGAPRTASDCEKAERPKERNVPFNVMMLKSDKHKQAKTPEGGASYVFPNLSLLDVPPAQRHDDQSWIEEQRELLNVTLKNFNVRAQVVHVTQGPSVTRFEVHPEPGVKVNKITNLADDIKLSLSAKDIRIEAPIPGKTRSALKFRTA